MNMSVNSRNPLWSEFIKALKQEVVPALGCTEPISLALAAAIARKYLEVVPEYIDAKVSPNLMKNGMGVTVPGTGTVGLIIAAAVGAIGGNPEGRLEVLKGLTTEQVDAAKEMIAQKRVTLTLANVPNILYSEVLMRAGVHSVRVCIADTHTNIILIQRDEEVIFKAEDNSKNAVSKHNYSMEAVTIIDICDFATQAPLEMIEFISESAVLNSALAKEGLTGNYGLHIAASLQRQIQCGLMPDGLMTQILLQTTAASDARMGGATLPAMTNSGSGNQGIAATMPVVVVAEHVKADRETLIRALILSHLVAIYIHSRLPKLSALCAVTTASMGAAAGMAWLLKGGYQAVDRAISSMIGDISGVICDGASNSCAMKVSTSATSAYKSVLMALDGTQVTGNEGIVSSSVDDSITNLGQLASQGMLETDIQILKIMMNKQKVI